jgi:hypothetical protein
VNEVVLIVIRIVFVVLEDIRTFVFLNNLVTVLVSFPVYVKVAHFLLVFWWCVLFYVVWFMFSFLFICRTVIVM